MRGKAARLLALILVLANAGLIYYGVRHRSADDSPPVGSVKPIVLPTTSSPSPSSAPAFHRDAAKVKSTSPLPGPLYSAANTVLAWRATGGCSAPSNLAISHNSGSTYLFAVQPAPHLLDITATGHQTGTAVGADAFCRPTKYVTTDGGRSWKPRSLKGVWFALPTSVYAPIGKLVQPCPGRVVSLSHVGSDALVQCARGVYRTDDAGRHWSAAGMLPPGTVESLSLAGGGHAVLLMSDSSDCKGVLVVLSSDGGQSWQAGQCLRVTHTPTFVSLARDGRGQTSSLNSVYRTTDYGKTWN
ncbi:MAG TPA: hypothetical protein VHE57_01750 [Mycobacteriales bacterium]|nr:hypothetical protein [Mycobacteriales bacterium]